MHCTSDVGQLTPELTPDRHDVLILAQGLGLRLRPSLHLYIRQVPPQSSGPFISLGNISTLEASS